LVFSAIEVLPGREQVVILGAEWHGMDGQQSVVGQHEDDHLEQVAGPVWSDSQLLRWVGDRIEVDHDERVICA
jgi:hypothetical protein